MSRPNRIQFIEPPELPKPTGFEKTVQAMALAFFFLAGVLILLALLLGVIALGNVVFA
jgi:hypothetical protein